MATTSPVPRPVRGFTLSVSYDKRKLRVLFEASSISLALELDVDKARRLFRWMITLLTNSFSQLVWFLLVLTASLLVLSVLVGPEKAAEVTLRFLELVFRKGTS